MSPLLVETEYPSILLRRGRRSLAGITAILIPIIVLNYSVEPADRPLAWLATGITAVLVAAHLLLPWNRMPRWSWSVPPIAFLIVIQLMREIDGGSGSIYNALIFAPLLWISLHAGRRAIIACLLGIAAMFTAPIVLAPDADTLVRELQRAAQWLLVAALVSFSVRAFIRNLVAREQTCLDTFEELPETVVIRFDENLRFTSVRGPGFGTVGGVEWHMLVGRSPFDIFDPQSAVNFTAHLRRALDGDAHSFRWTSTDGTRTHHVSVTSTVARDATHEELASGLLLVRDISEIVAGHEAAAQLAAIVATSSEAILTTDTSGTITSWNDAAHDLFGYRSVDAIGMSIAALVPIEPAIIAQQSDLLARARRGEPTRSIDTQRMHKDGTIVDVQLSLSPMHDASGTLLGFSGLMIATGERTRLEREVRSARALLESVLDNATALIYAKRADGEYLLVNREFERTFQLDRSEIIGKYDQDLFPPSIVSIWRDNDQRVLRERRPLALEEHASHDGGIHTYTSVKFPLYDGDDEAPYGTAGISTDITDRRRIEQQLDRERGLLHAALSSLHDGVIVFNTDGQVELANDSFRQLHGVPDDMELHCVDDIAPFVRIEQDQADTTPSMYLASPGGSEQDRGEAPDVTYELTRTDETTRVVTASRARVSERGSHYGWVVAVHDITAQRATQRALAERNHG